MFLKCMAFDVFFTNITVNYINMKLMGGKNCAFIYKSFAYFALCLSKLNEISSPMRIANEALPEVSIDCVIPT